MLKEEIRMEWERLLLGKAPWEFMAEIFIRTLIIYFILLLILRFIGRRLNAQLSITEIAITLSLGAIISVPFQLPERGLLPACMILAFVVALLRGINMLEFKSSRITTFIKGKMTMIIKDGVLQQAAMKNEFLSRERLFSVLRLKKIKHLGEVKRVYMETSGNFSIFQNKEPLPGLSILPEGDVELKESYQPVKGYNACANCGHVEKDIKTDKTSCRFCHHKNWTLAYK